MNIKYENFLNKRVRIFVFGHKIFGKSNIQVFDNILIKVLKNNSLRA